ncbi:MAG TPA: DUF2249 domain-containing protein [Candidatus Binatia bacterium]|nr:DUF2249 domain-containing protein [Candidatus Binatia bacterium]
MAGVISAGTPLGRLLDEHPELVEVLAGYHPHFGRLRNRLLRKVMAPRVTVAEAARMAGVPAEDLLRVLSEALGEAVGADDTAGARAAAGEAVPRPTALARLGEADVVRLDVREDIRRGKEPLGRIMTAVKGLGPGQVLVVRAPFEPVPLYEVLGRRGLAHWTERHAADDWSVWFYRPDAASGESGREADEVSAPAAAGSPPGAGRAPRTVRIDVRGLEPPMPMVLVLERLERLEADEQLEVIHERRPLFLYPLIVERGFVHETDEPGPGVLRILIRRAAQR